MAMVVVLANGEKSAVLAKAGAKYLGRDAEGDLYRVDGWDQDTSGPLMDEVVREAEVVGTRPAPVFFRYRLRIDKHPNMVNLPMWHTAFGWGPRDKALVMDDPEEVRRAARSVRVPQNVKDPEVEFTIESEERVVLTEVGLRSVPKD